LNLKVEVADIRFLCLNLGYQVSRFLLVLALQVGYLIVDEVQVERVLDFRDVEVLDLIVINVLGIVASEHLIAHILQVFEVASSDLGQVTLTLGEFELQLLDLVVAFLQ
jgi:hypothetical protein